MTPCFWAKRTRRSRARCISLASVGKVIAFSWTVVSTITCWKSAGVAAPVRVATARLSCKALLDEGDQPLLAHPLAPARQRGTVKRGRVLEELFATEQLPVGGLDPTLAEHLSRAPHLSGRA